MLQFNSVCKKTRRSSRENKDLIWSGVKWQGGRGCRMVGVSCHEGKVSGHSISDLIAADLTMWPRWHKVGRSCFLIPIDSCNDLIEWPDTSTLWLVTFTIDISLALVDIWHRTRSNPYFPYWNNVSFCRGSVELQDGWQQLELLLLTLKLVSLCWFRLL